MKIIKKEVPVVQGFYFVKLKSVSHWQLLVNVIGVAPFMGIGTIHTLFKSSDDQILSNLLDLDWSEPISMFLDEEFYCGCLINTEVKNNIIEKLKNESLLNAVKYLKDYSRQQDTVIGLKEAKEYCDNLQFKLKIDGILK